LGGASVLLLRHVERSNDDDDGHNPELNAKPNEGSPPCSASSKRVVNASLSCRYSSDASLAANETSLTVGRVGLGRLELPTSCDPDGAS
jgi:hypothetical protein